MRFILSGTLAIGLLTSLAGAAAELEVKGDCARLEERMLLSPTGKQKAECTAVVTTASGKRIAKKYVASVELVPKTLGSNAEKTEALIITENCEICGTNERRRYGVNEFAKVTELIKTSMAESAEGLDADDAVAAELAEGLESCTLTQAGRPTNLRGAALLQCRINQMNSKDAESAVEYFRRWLQPELQGLVRSLDPAAQQLGVQALQLIDRAHQGEPRIRESLKDMGHFAFYRAKVEELGQAIEAAGPNPQLRTAEVARLGVLQRQWTSTYLKRRQALADQGVTDENLERSSKLMESSLNRMYAKYGDEIKQAQGQTGGRTQFGSPANRPGPVAPATPRTAAPAPVAPGAQKFNQQILRPR